MYLWDKSFLIIYYNLNITLEYVQKVPVMKNNKTLLIYKILILVMRMSLIHEKLSWGMTTIMLQQTELSAPGW